MDTRVRMRVYAYVYLFMYVHHVITFQEFITRVTAVLASRVRFDALPTAVF